MREHERRESGKLFNDLSFVSVNSVECYVCTAQEQNDDKCIKTVNTCATDQSMCMSRVEFKCKYRQIRRYYSFTIGR